MPRSRSLPRALPRPAASGPRGPAAPGHDLLLQGAALLTAGRIDEAVPVFEAAVRAAPTAVKAHLLLGQAHRAGKRPVDAARAFHAAAQLDPKNVLALAYLGDALREIRQPEEALKVLARALAVAPDDEASRFFRGMARHDVGDLAPALEDYVWFLARKPEHQSARFNAGIARLALGDWREGWALHESRRHLIERAGLGTLAIPDGPEWSGDDPSGRHLLVVQEQGLGDQLQFLRFAKILKDRGARVTYQCHPALHPLLEGHPFIDALATRDAPLPPYDAWVLVMSLPHKLGTAGELFGSLVPYLDAPHGEPTLDALEQALGPMRPRVGVVWGGNPAHLNDRNRSIGLAPLAPLLGRRDIRWVSLQKGPRERELAEAAPELRAALVDASPWLTDFAATARVIRALDAVITVDTAVAHLAGAMGVPTVLLLPATPDWRWGMTDADTDWYPGMRIFRQPTARDWASVVQTLDAALLARRAA